MGLFVCFFFLFYKSPFSPVLVQGNPPHPAPACLSAFAAAGIFLLLCPIWPTRSTGNVPPWEALQFGCCFTYIFILKIKSVPAVGTLPTGLQYAKVNRAKWHWLQLPVHTVPLDPSIICWSWTGSGWDCWFLYDTMRSVKKQGWLLPTEKVGACWRAARNPPPPNIMAVYCLRGHCFPHKWVFRGDMGKDYLSSLPPVCEPVPEGKSRREGFPEQGVTCTGTWDGKSQKNTVTKPLSSGLGFASPFVGEVSAFLGQAALTQHVWQARAGKSYRDEQVPWVPE